jgi:hypothetical protein
MLISSGRIRRSKQKPKPAANFPQPANDANADDVSGHVERVAFVLRPMNVVELIHERPISTQSDVEGHYEEINPDPDPGTD